MALEVKRLKVITLTIGGISVECQLSSWTLDPGVQDGDHIYTYCPDGAAVAETPVGGDRGDNETTEITFQVIGDPVYSRP
jgi:hypothetical protein